MAKTSMTILRQAIYSKLYIRYFLRFILYAVTVAALIYLLKNPHLFVTVSFNTNSGKVSRLVSSVNGNSKKSVITCEVDKKRNIEDPTPLHWNMSEGLIHISQMVRMKELNCKSLFKTPQQNSTKPFNLNLNAGSIIDAEAYLNLTLDCKKFHFSRGYIMSSLTQEEEDFPLAFSMLVYRDVEAVERLLRAIYRPQNYYCIHVDSKAPDVFYRAVSSIAKCFPNVFLTSRRIDVQWGRFSVLEPELQCMEELWRYPRWKYFMSLTGQEFPLKTNFELVKILTAYGGANDVQCMVKKARVERWRNSRPSHGIQPIKGSVHIAVNRDYVGYALHNETAHSLLQWVKNTDIPDETFFATLHCNPQLGIRGSYMGDPDSEKPFLTRFKHWEHRGHSCAGVFIHGVCIFSIGDLPLLGKAQHLFANKFHLDKDRTVIACLEEKIFNDTRDEYLGVKNFSADFYASLDFVKNKVN